MEERLGGIFMEKSEQLGKVYAAIEKLCNDKDITDEELKLTEEYLEALGKTIDYFENQNNFWEMFGIEHSELSGDGFVRDIVASIGEEKFIEARSEMINKWKKELAEIESKVEKIKKRS